MPDLRPSWVWPKRSLKIVWFSSHVRFPDLKNQLCSSAPMGGRYTHRNGSWSNCSAGTRPSFGIIRGRVGCKTASQGKATREDSLDEIRNFWRPAKLRRNGFVKGWVPQSLVNILLYNTNKIDSMSSLLSLKFDPCPNKARRMTQANHRFAKNDLGGQSWVYPNSLLDGTGKSPSQMDDN